VNIRPDTWILMALCCAAGAATAQQAAPAAAPAMKSTPQTEAGEPRADTSDPESAAAPASSAGQGSSAGPATSADRAPAGGAAPEGKAPLAARSTASGPAAGHTGNATASADKKSATKADRLDLGMATVTGDREQPKVMYIVPWKRSDIGDLAGKPMNSLVDEILAPVDRDVFKREVVYYRAVQADASQNGAQPKAAPQGEK
jgi:hypothetical protein